MTRADPGLLCLVQWLSPAFPTGGYACSHGLEWAIAAGDVTGGQAVRDWIGDILTHGSGRTDAILLAHALKDDADMADLADLARALAPSAERLRETEEQGAAFAIATSALVGQDLPPLPLPLAVGQAARGFHLPVAQVIALYLHSFAANLVSAAVRFVPLGQTEGQQILASLHAVIQPLASETATAPLAAITTAAFRGDTAAMRHETMDVRIFKT